jgi:hypothetical protein
LFVSPGGEPANDGSFDRPLDLQTALAAAGPARPGDTIWLRGGVYRGTFVSAIAGTPENPIHVRAYPHERPILDGAPASAETVLLVRGGHVVYRGLEITNSNPRRTARTVGSNPPDRRGPGLELYAPGVKVIGAVVHDTGTGIGVWKSAVGAEVYGSLVYYNGWRAPDRGHGHGIYVQNETGTVRLVDNVVFSQFRGGVHAFGSENAFLNNIHLEGNTIFNNGALANERFHEQNILIGGGRVAENPALIANATYQPPGKGGQNNLGYSAGCRRPTVRDNYLVGGQLLTLVNCEEVTITGNTFVGSVDESFPSIHPDNTYQSRRPESPKVIVRPSRYEPNHAHVTVFNWARQESVDVDLSGALEPGTKYDVYRVDDLSDPVLTATYTGGTVSMPMQASEATAPVGLSSPPSTAPEFQVFVVEPARPRNWTMTSAVGLVAAAAGLISLAGLRKAWWR